MKAIFVELGQVKLGQRRGTRSAQGSRGPIFQRDEQNTQTVSRVGNIQEGQIHKTNHIVELPLYFTPITAAGVSLGGREMDAAAKSGRLSNSPAS